MKKSIASALTTALVVGAASTTFAAANPFSDVPAGHWAYDAVTQLAADGIIEGYGDGTFLGNRNITRYEMAQMVAKALARNPQGADRATLDRLMAEFSEELNNLGVRVANLEKYADKVIWQGKIEYTYKSHRWDYGGRTKYKENEDNYVFRFEPIAEVNDHWTIRARIDASGNMKHDSTDSFKLVRGWAQGDYSNFQVKVGRAPLYTNEDGLIWDTEYSGAEVSFGNKLKATIFGGRLADDKVSGGVRGFADYGGYRPEGTDPSSIVGLNVQYTPKEHGLFGGVGYYHIKDSDLGGRGDYRNYLYSRHGNEDTANIWSINAGYQFGRKAKLWGAYARNGEADWEKHSWQAQFKYGTYADRAKRNDWAAWVGYKKLGTNTSLYGIDWDDALLGTRGIIAGAAWAPMDNVGLVLKYFNGKYITGDGDAERLFARVEIFF